MSADQFTEQQKALEIATRLYGTTAFTVHHKHYCMVGLRKDGKAYVGISDNFEAACELLARRQARI